MGRGELRQVQSKAELRFRMSKTFCESHFGTCIETLFPYGSKGLNFGTV